MDRNRSGLLVRLLPLFLIFPSHAFPQVQGVSLSIRFAGGTSQFHVGEVIPIELSFVASQPETFVVSTRNYDRSGRLDIEQFHVTPPGRDPLADYFAVGACIRGGLGGSQALGTEPFVMHEDLNEWVALDNPGHYALNVTTGRVSRRGATEDERLELRSNSLEFDVLEASPEWQEETFGEAVSILNFSTSTDEQRRDAIRKLRFLDSPKSIRELAKQMSNFPPGRRFDCVAGLAGSRFQSEAVRELKRQMQSPDIAITADYIYTLAKLETQVQHHLPPYPENDADQQKIWEEQRRAYDKKFTDLEDALYKETAALVGSKQGHAQAGTINTLLLRTGPGSPDMKPLAGLPGPELASAFLALSPDQEWELLSSFWERLKIPSMTEALEAIANESEIKNQMLRDIVLQRLYELDPGEATPYILDEIKRPHIDDGSFTVKAKTLGVLPNQTLPELDQLLASRLEQRDSRTRALDAQLVARYSTKAILFRVKAVYEEHPGRWDCVAEDGFVLYFLRTEPEYGIKQLAVAPSTCMTESMAAVVKMKRWNEIEASIIAQLDNPDLNRARQAAETLSKYGGPKAEAAMWQRLRRFHQEWAVRENELTNRRILSRNATEAIGFQYGMDLSLAQAQGWVLSNEQVSELEQLTLGSQRDNVKQYHWKSPVELSVNDFFGGELRVDINNQYFPQGLASLSAKLRQYPSGTKFQVAIHGEEGRVAPVVETIRETALDAGFTLEITH
ncbi:MAG TPA: hypothetical protein VGS78_08940 [Candidatus Sulfotelmatobacter sp.]|nr:hypothetical protein [Candidatus Sulfotelmatobacter sp.]